MSDEERKLAEEFGGVWGEHPDHLVSDWKDEVSNDDDRRGYWSWVASRIEQEADDNGCE